MFYTKNSVIKTHFTYKPIVISICNYSFNNVTLIYFFPILVKQACDSDQQSLPSLAPNRQVYLLDESLESGRHRLEITNR